MRDNDNSVPEAPEEKGQETYNEGYPLYPSSEDIYNKSKKTNTDESALYNDKNGANKLVPGSEAQYDDKASGGTLDVPGAELDDEQERIGSEDEENNYYSLGGDEHNDLEESKE